MLGEYYAVEHEVGGSDSILEVDIFDLLVEGSPEFPDMASDEDATAQFRPAFERGVSGQIDHLPVPGPFGVYSVLLAIPQFFLLFLLNLLSDNFDGLECDGPDGLILVE